MTRTIAIGHRPGEVAIWCEIHREYESGAILFDVINGAWRGTLKDGVVTVHDTDGVHPGFEVWRGEVPREHARDYNTAIEWIREQIEPRCVGAHDRCFGGTSAPCPYCEPRYLHD